MKEWDGDWWRDPGANVPQCPSTLGIPLTLPGPTNQRSTDWGELCTANPTGWGHWRTRFIATQNNKRMTQNTKRCWERRIDKKEGMWCSMKNVALPTHPTLAQIPGCLYSQFMSSFSFRATPVPLYRPCQVPSSPWWANWSHPANLESGCNY